MPDVNVPVARYFPPATGQYVITPGFYRLGHDFGNEQADTRLFQIDRQFSDYRQTKLTAHAENPDKYICQDPRSQQLEPALNRFLIHRLTAEYPQYFQLRESGHEYHLDCSLTGETLNFTDEGDYLGTSGDCRYINGLDALAMQIQEDLALIHLEEETNRLVAIHLCQPNHWDPREKIGQDFTAIHQPVPGMERINSRAAQLLQACLQQGPYVRFAWGIATDDRLNHHPEPPETIAPVHWAGRQFDPGDPAAWLRVERQVLYGLADINAVLFTIRTYHYALDSLSREQHELLQQALAGMEPESLVYKGLSDSQQAIIEWLQRL